MPTAQGSPDAESAFGTEEFCSVTDALHPFSALTKRVMDLAGAAAMIVLLSPVFLLIVALVKLQDGGRVIYRRRVVGPNGEFDAYKFRSMRPNADALLSGNPQLRAAFEKNFKLKADPRVTRIGFFLRRYSLDELPQLFNVLKGEMSLVGPRMISPAELDKYGSNRQLLLTVRPGLTGYWQVHGRQQVSYAERVAMDIFYIQHWSMLLDLKILWRTPWKVLRGEGAY
jgi:lipopolysaccharide/colanic/teichoic acid biosynthesis glycosyltransferase